MFYTHKKQLCETVIFIGTTKAAFKGAFKWAKKLDFDAFFVGCHYFI